MNHKKDSLEKENPKKVPLVSFGIYIMSLGDIHFTHDAGCKTGFLRMAVVQSSRQLPNKGKN